MEAKGISGRTILHVHRVVHGALAKAVDDGLLASNPAARISAPKPAITNPNVWGLEHVRTFLAGVVDHPHREFFNIMLSTGLRASEMAGLKWNAVDLEAQFISVVNVRTRVTGLGILENAPKTAKSRRRVSFGCGAARELKRLRARQEGQRGAAGDSWTESGYLFTDAMGNPVDVQVHSRAFKKCVANLSLPYLTLKNLRHVHATMLLLAGINVKVVSERLGHSSTRVTYDVYCHILPDLERTAASVLDGLLGRRNTVEN